MYCSNYKEIAKNEIGKKIYIDNVSSELIIYFISFIFVSFLEKVVFRIHTFE